MGIWFLPIDMGRGSVILSQRFCGHVVAQAIEVLSLTNQAAIIIEIRQPAKKEAAQ